MDPLEYRDSMIEKLPKLEVLDEVNTRTEGGEFYTAIHQSFELEPEMVFVDKYTWSKGIDKQINRLITLLWQIFNGTIFRYTCQCKWR